MTRLTCYDGVGCIGGNKILLEDGDTKLWLDFGLDFGRMGKYYEEYLKPKTCLGLYEPVQMDLLPPVRDLYRQDLVCRLVDPWLGVNTIGLGDVQGIILSHAHLDHIGSLHYIREDIPIYASAMTAAIAKASQDTGGSSPDDYCYVTPCEECESGEITSTRRAASKPRPLMLMGESPSDGFAEFWNTTPSSRDHETGEISTVSACGGLKARRFPVDHSVHGACAWVIETSAGAVVYAGDLRCHGRAGDLTLRFAEEVGKLRPRVLVIEGTRISSDTTATEDQVCARAVEEVRKATGLVVADFGPRNIERLSSFLDIAKETGRKLVLLPKDVYLLRSMALAGGEWSVPALGDPRIAVYGEFQAGYRKGWQKLVEAEFADRYVRPQEIAANQADYICCFSFFDVNELAVLRPRPGSVWVYSSCEAFNEEMMIDFQRLENWLRRWEMALLGGRSDDEKSPFHVSGHACRSDLLRIIETIGPQAVIPVHTEAKHLQLYAELLKGRCDVILPERGMPVDL